MKHVDALTPIRKERALGEPSLIRFDPAKHPGIIRRMFLSGFPPPQVAAVLGVTPHTLHEWKSEHASVAQAFRASLEYRGRIAEAIYNAAMVYDEENDKYIGTNPTLLKFLALTQLGWREQGLPDDNALPAPARGQLQREQLDSLLEKVKALTADSSVIEVAAEREEA